MRDYDGKTTKVSKTDDYLTEQVIIPSITESALNVYVNFSETAEGVYMKAFYFNGADVYIRCRKQQSVHVHTWFNEKVREIGGFGVFGQPVE